MASLTSPIVPHMPLGCLIFGVLGPYLFLSFDLQQGSAAPQRFLSSTAYTSCPQCLQRRGLIQPLSSLHVVHIQPLNT